MLGISPSTLTGVLSGSASDSTIFRVRAGLTGSLGLSAVYSNEPDWFYANKPEIRASINSLCDLLSELRDAIVQSNSLASDGILNEIDRQQILAVLKAFLAELEAPAISVVRSRTISKWLSKIGTKAAEKSVEGGIAKMIEQASSRLSELIAKLLGGSPFDF